MFDTLYSQIGAAIGVAVVAFAFLKGDEPERVGGGVYALGALASLLLQDDTRLYGPQWGLMGLDAVLLAAYAAVAWKSRRSWPSGCRNVVRPSATPSMCTRWPSIRARPVATHSRASG